MAKLNPPSTCTTNIESELASNFRRTFVRSDFNSLQNSVGVHLRLKSAHDCSLVSSPCTIKLVELIRAILGGMIVSWKIIRIVVTDEISGHEIWGCSQMKEEVFCATVR